MDAYTERSTPPLSDCETTSSTRVDLSSPPFARTGSKLPSHRKSLTSSSVTSALDSERLICSNAKGKLVQRSRNHSRSSGSGGNLPLVGPLTKPRIVHQAPPYEIQFAKKQILDGSYRSFNLQDLREGRELLQRGLSLMSDDSFCKAVQLKQATKEDLRHQLMHTTWWLERNRREKSFLKSLKREQEGEFKMAEMEMEIFRGFITTRGLPALQDDKDYLEAVFLEDLDQYDVASEQYDQFLTHAEKRAAPFPNSSDTEPSDSHSDVGSDDSLIYQLDE
ncbi:uncharacterized protein F5147DRAFT_650664 [Suillus discolor]|uniref:Uncharacterized protein n=1 Tax=Suillus discolor TaxID=1912936 RepID=A0A9P7FBB7_9AGAM|nr:uncharacterized protein F5147DRAFT_650664 [Suillus discolor]KAG2113136.1 hypothetical protein F5147DRAFT_650664 [Suillus discolor]